VDSTLLQVVEEAQDAQEQVDEVEVEADSAHDKLIRRKLRVNEVRVVDDVAREDEASTNCIDQVHRFAEGDEELYEAGHAESNQGPEEEWAHPFKIILGLESKDGQANEYAKRK